MDENELKKVIKKTMPFVQLIRDNVTEHGRSALELSSSFDETAVLAENVDYMRRCFDLDHIHIRCTDETDVEEKIVDACCPGSPFIVFDCG
jgi:hypothetical protein